MAQYNRPPKVKAKGPDEFVSFFDHLVRYFFIHRIKFIIVLLIGVTAFAGYGVFLYYQNYRVKEFAAIYQEALNASGPEALAKWKDLATQHPPKKLSDVIDIQQGGILAGEKNWEAAAQSYTQAAQSKSELLKYLSGWAEAVSFENAGKYPEALASYQKIRKESENPFKDFAGLGEAQIWMAQGKTDQAQSVLMELMGEGSAVPAAVKMAAMNKILALQLPDAMVIAPETQKTNP